MDFSPAELALLSKFKTIKEKRAQQEARNKREKDMSEISASRERERDARQVAIDIIRARRMASGLPSHGVTGASPHKKTKIKLTSSVSTSSKDIHATIKPRDSAEAEPEEKKRKKVHVVQVRRRGTAAQKQHQEQQEIPGSHGTHALFIDNLPAECTSDDLYHYFAEQWSVSVVNTGVYPGCCSGLVTCSSLEDAEYVMNEQTQHEFELGGNILSITWATEDDINALDGTMGFTDGPAPVDPRVQQRAKDLQDQTMDTSQGDEEEEDARGRNVVSYDDL